MQSEFYLDPRNPALKQVTATLEFSHRVDRLELEKRLRLKWSVEPTSSLQAVQRPALHARRR